MPNHSVNLLSKRSWSIVSKAADKSKSERAVSSPRSWADKISFWIYNKAISVEFPLLYADWRLFEIPEFCMWDFIWLATIFSINLETKFNTDTCLKLLKSFRSSEGFFNSSVTWAILKVSGNFPSANERFMIIVIDPARISALSLTIWVGHGSRSHDLLGDYRISFDTLLSEIFEKVSKGVGAAGGVGSGWMFKSDFADSRVSLILANHWTS